jgi:hypothetical protein
MIDPMVSLAFSVYSNKGVYALLLGSGISRASGIPTGWEVVIDLIRKVAKLEGGDCEPDPADWYRTKHSTEPDYSKLLDEIVKTPTERQQLLRRYFEPTDEERTQGQKHPTKAHRAIAHLVSAGYIRVIITTNFDRLTERSLEEAGVTPTIISTADQLVGAVPLAHSGVTVIKLHGDYLDTRIKNTGQELATYDKEMDSLLDRVLDEYGLIICGWSGDWDTALCSALERCPSRRFSTYWTTVSGLSEKGRRLVDHRRATVVKITDANHLFESVREKVQALEDMAAPHPLSAKMAAASVKRFIVEPSSKIRLHDLIHEETEKLFKEICSPMFGGDTQLEPKGALQSRADKYRTLCDTLLHILVTGCYWGSSEHSRYWMRALQRISDIGTVGGYTYLTKFRRYPALLLLYGAGLAAVASGNYHNLAAILLNTKVKDDHSKLVPLCLEVYAFAVISDKNCFLPGYEQRRTPVSEHLCKELRALFCDYIPGQEEYESAFDRFEYLLGLVHADLNRREWENGWWGPIGCFVWRGRHFGVSISEQISEELEAAGTNWPLLKAGFFGSSLDQAKTAKANFDSFLKRIPSF